MSQNITSQLDQVCRRRRRRRVLTLVCWALASIVAIGLLLVGLDWVLGIADPLGRFVLSAAFVGAALAIGRRCVLSIGDHTETPLQVARQLEFKHPELRDVIANAWEFANQSDDDPTAGSAALRRAVVVRAASAVESIDWEELIPRQSLHRGMLALGCIAVVSIAIFWYLPDTMATGVARLVNPLNPREWPREHNLEFVDPPSLIAAGEHLNLQLRDTSGTLPTEVVVSFRTRRQKRWHEEAQSFSTTGDLLEVRRPTVQHSLEYRAVGGDHRTMPWQTLQVVPRPIISELAISVRPPAYTGLPTSEWSRGTTVFAGSELQLHGRVDQPISRVVLQGAKGYQQPASLDADQTTFRLADAQWIAERTDRYHLQLTTLDNVTTRASQEIAIEVNIDQPPEVRFVEPAEDLTVVPTAVVPLRVAAQDELAVRKVSLVYQRSDRSQGGEQHVALWEASHAVGSAAAIQTIEVEHNLDVAPLKLLPGTVVELRAQATDAQPMTGQSIRPLRLKVVAEGQLWQLILDRQSQLVEALAQALREQRELLQTTDEWSRWPDWSPTRWTNSVHVGLFRQRQLANTLGSGQASVLHQIDALVATIQRNQLGRPDVIERLQTAQSQIQRLLDKPLVDAEDSLSEILRQARRRLDRLKMQTRCSQAKIAQQEIVVGLEGAIDLLLPGNMLGRLERKLADLENTQRVLLKRCQDEAAAQILQPASEELQQRELLIRVGREQRELTGRFASLLLELSQTAERLADDDPPLALRLVETETCAQELGTQLTLQLAADHLARRRVGKAIAAQQTVIDDLVTLRALLAGRHAESKRERLDQLRATERELQRLRRQTLALERELEKISPQERARALERLRRQREALAKQSEQLARRLESLSVPKAAKQTAEATTDLQRTKLDRQTTKQARKKLDAAQQALTTERRRQQATLARLQMAQLDAKLRSLVGLQQAILPEITRLDSLRVQHVELPESIQQSVAQLADRQAILGEDVTAEAEKLDSLPVFSYLLKQAAATMQEVENRLQQTELGQGTQTIADAAARQLSEIIASLKQEQQGLSDAKQEAGGRGGQDAGDTPQAQTLQLALGQLKLLKSLQTALQEETHALEAAVAAGEQVEREAADLARRQRELVELAKQLVPEPPDPPTEELIPSLEQELEKSFDELLLREIE